MNCAGSIQPRGQSRTGILPVIARFLLAHLFGTHGRKRVACIRQMLESWLTGWKPVLLRGKGYMFAEP